ncbi:helix-turn-helix transcriptional regulator, partial [bacterium]|nr:helix-turn-helix transcriptional regulator [bacterium]
MVSETRRKKDEERKARTRRLLLDAAARVFAQNGYHAPRIADIVAEANVGQGTFYRNFTDKRDIFETLFDEFQADLVNE